MVVNLLVPLELFFFSLLFFSECLCLSQLSLNFFLCSFGPLAFDAIDAADFVLEEDIAASNKDEQTYVGYDVKDDNCDESPANVLLVFYLPHPLSEGKEWV